MGGGGGWVSGWGWVGVCVGRWMCVGDSVGGNV